MKRTLCIMSDILITFGLVWAVLSMAINKEVDGYEMGVVIAVFGAILGTIGRQESTKEKKNEKP